MADNPTHEFPHCHVMGEAKSNSGQVAILRVGLQACAGAAEEAGRVASYGVTMRIDKRTLCLRMPRVAFGVSSDYLDVTVHTYFKLLLLMREFVFVQVGRVDEGGRALLALVGLLARVRAHVHHQVVLVLALVRTQIAKEVERVCVYHPVKKIYTFLVILYNLDGPKKLTGVSQRKLLHLSKKNCTIELEIDIITTINKFNHTILPFL